MSTATGELLVAVVDVTPSAWVLAAGGTPGAALGFDTYVEHVLAFLHAFALLSPSNSLAVLASMPPLPSTASPWLFPVPGTGTVGGSVATEFAAVQQQVLGQLRALASAAAAPPSSPAPPVAGRASAPCLAGALSMALCYINRLSKQRGARVRARVLVVHASPDAPSQYIPLMNCIFSAQKQGIIVDGCLVAAADSAFLQQAAQITGGVYLRPQHPAGLLHYLLSFVLAEPHVRKQLVMPALNSVDFRAACFCHKRVVDMAFVCSVCLSIYCSFVPVCKSCDAKFPIPKAPRTSKAAAPLARPQSIVK